MSVNPTGKWEIEYRRNDGQIFFRRILTGELIFKGVDYTYLNSIVDNLVSYPGGCTYIDFVIYCDEEEFWTGQFKYPYSFTFDDDSCIATGTPEVVDEYSCIMDYYEQEYLMPIRPAPIDIELRTCPPGNVLLKDFGFTSSLKEYLDYLINHIDAIDCDLTLKSSFMWRDDFPNGDNYVASYGGDNYVTGNFNRLDCIYLYQNTSLRLNLGGTLCEEQSKFSFRQFEELLRNAFNAYWYIDENGDFRIEHISFFLPGFAHSDFGSWIDLSTLMSGCNSYAERRNKYKHLTDKLFDQEKWKWQHWEGTEGEVAHGVDFEGEPIYYGIEENRKADCVYGEFKEKIYSIPNFFTDIYWAYQLEALFEADTIGCPGWCMWDVNVATNYIRCETGILSGVSTINGHLSTANLHDNFFRWDRIFLNGNMNGVDEVFDSAQKLKLQEEIEFPLCCSDEFDPMKTIITEMGEGTIHSAVQTPYSLKIQLLYD